MAAAAADGAQPQQSEGSPARQAFLARPLPELWPTQASRDAAGGLRDLMRALAAHQPARRGPDPAPRGAPAPLITRGALPTTPMADCGVDLGRAPGQLQRGRLRGGRRPPSRARGRVRTLLLPRLHGGVDIEGDDLTTGLLSLRRVMAKGLRPPPPLTGARRPPMHEAASPEVEDGWMALRTALARGTFTYRLGSTSTLRLRYRSTELRVPLDWATRYLARYLDTRGTITSHQSRGPISGPGYVMDVFWPRFRDRTAGLPNRGGYGRLIGCWMLPYDESEGLPPSLFFQGGSAQRAVHELMCQLTHAYASSIRVPWTTTFAGANKLVDDSGWCDHLGAFIEAILAGEPVKALKHNTAYPERSDNAACSGLLINYANGDSESLHASEYQENPCYGLRGYERVDRGPCSEIIDDCGAFGDTGTALLPWNDYTIVVEERGYSPSPYRGYGGRTYTWFRHDDARSANPEPWPYPPDATATACALQERRLLFQPAHLAFDAEVCDTLMFMAQICLDYAKALFRGDEPGWSDRALESVQAGQQFAQYALALIADRSRLLAHEIGHLYLKGSPHCGYDTERDGDHRWRSCFDVASRFLWAHATAENGLPADTYVSEFALTTGEISGLITQADFGDRRYRDGDNDRPFWVYKWANSHIACQVVRDGDEDRSFDAEDFRKGPQTVCAGYYSIVLSSPGAWGGGFTFKTTDGCICAAPAVVDPSTTTGWSYSAGGCPAAAIGARGVFFVPET